MISANRHPQGFMLRGQQSNRAQQMLEVLLRRHARYRADYEVQRSQSQRLAASFPIVAGRIESVQVNAVGNHNHLFAVTLQDAALREDFPPNRFRFADDFCASGFVAQPGRQGASVDSLDDAPHAGLLCRGDRVGPGVYQARVDAIAPKPSGQPLAIAVARPVVTIIPRRIGSRLPIADHGWNTQALGARDKPARTESIEVRGKLASVETFHQRQASQFLATEIKTVANECQSNHEL